MLCELKPNSQIRGTDSWGPEEGVGLDKMGEGGQKVQNPVIRKISPRDTTYNIVTIVTKAGLYL